MSQRNAARNRFYSIVCAWFSCLLLAGLLVACGDAPATTGITPARTAANAAPGVSDSEIVLGSWGPQSGPAASYGVVDRAIDAYFKKINAEGGINGRKIKFLTEDDGYNPARTLTAVKKLVEQDQVFALVGGMGTAQNVAVTDYLVSHNVPHVAPATGSSVMCCQPLKRNIFALQTNYSVEAKLLTRYAHNSLNLKKAAVFYQNDPFGKEGLEAIQAELKSLNLSEAQAVSYDTSEKDFSSQALKLQATGADTLILWSTPQPTAAILKEIQKLGWKPTILMSVVNDDPVMFQLAGSALDGVTFSMWLPNFMDSNDPKIKQYNEFMKQYMPTEPVGGFSLTGMAIAQVMVEGLKRAGRDLTRESFINAMETFRDWNNGLAYKLNYSPVNRQGQNAVAFYQADAKNQIFVKKSEIIEDKP
ncbi:MAG TPA: ABC transporter substrate-binding protein [Chloroflexia bacterium]|nr:ABC transporter substrate-binding protein [Chloroflexia bacterium]